MTNEQRIERLEKLTTELIKDYATLKTQQAPTFERQFSADFNNADDMVNWGRKYKDCIITAWTESGKIAQVRRLHDEEYFAIGGNARVADLPYNLTIESFTETPLALFVTMIGPDGSTTIPLMEVVALTTGGASADWVAKHGVKEGEITAFRSIGKWDGIDANLLKRNDRGFYGDGHDLQSMIEGNFGSVKDGRFEIYEVKRVSDGSVWKLGDQVENNTGGTGSITEFKLQQGVMIVKATCYFLDRILEKVIKPAPSVKEWKIVEFKSKTDKSSWMLNAQGNYRASASGSLYQLSSMLTGNVSVQDGQVYIHSVRRISDNAIFKVGDRIIYFDHRDIFDIHKFSMKDGEIFINDHFNSQPKMRIRDWVMWQSRKPIFTTADGVPAYDGDIVYWTVRRLGRGLTGSIHESRASKIIDPSCYPDGYSTHAAAQAAIDAERKPLFKTADGVDVHEGTKLYAWHRNGKIASRFAKTGDGGQWYSTYAAAQKAYEKWIEDQPVLSLTDIEGIITWTQNERLRAIVKTKLNK